MDAKIDIIFAKDERTCQAVRAYDGRAIDPDEVPELPVPGCDAETCRCIYGNVFDDQVALDHFNRILELPRPQADRLFGWLNRLRVAD